MPSDREFTGGRFVPGIAGEIAHEQWHCYAFARRNVAGKHGIDVACGEGHRSALMAGVATVVTGIDIDTVVSFIRSSTCPVLVSPAARPIDRWKMGSKRILPRSKSGGVFGHPRGRTQTALRADLYARVSTHDQQTLPMQNRMMREYAARRGWQIVLQVKEIASGVVQRESREKLLAAARRREIEVVLVWRLDRWGRSVTALLATLQELEHMGVGFVSLTEALDLTTPAGRVMAGLLAVFAEFERELMRERVRAGLQHARQNGQRLGRPKTAALYADQVRQIYRAGKSKAEIARRLGIGRTSVRRILKTTITR